MEISIGKGNISLDNQGHIIDIIAFDKKSIYPENTAEYFIQIGIGQNLFAPTSMENSNNTLTFTFEKQAPVKVAYVEKSTHTTFEVIEISKSVEHITFGPIPNTISKMIGDVIGVVWDETYALGMQGLNIKTVPGFPYYKDIAYKKYGSDKIMSDISVGTCDYFRSAAYEATCGSILQMYCENRRIERRKRVNNVENVLVAPYDNEDADINGAKFAFFSCRGDEALETIGKLEVNEGLPHPIMNGEWAKTARTAMRSYFITEFGTNNIDKMLDYTIKGGFRELYHSEPFKTWGHFELMPKWFPNGDSDLAACSKIANARGIGIGVHTLSSFTTTNDSFVSPIPSKNLAKIGTELLANPLDDSATEIHLQDATLFGNQTFLQAIQIEDELIQFGGVNFETNVLENCIRGAFDTVKAPHPINCKVHMLWDYNYKTLFPDINLQDSFCDRLVELFNTCNIIQISFDGLEGCSYCGEDEYAVNRFCMRCYDGWQNEVINDASNLNHFLWHMNTRMNWGEPWGEKMRTGMIDARMRNQNFYKKNLFPRMLGWFLIRLSDRKFEATTLDDIEWALSEAAGFDAGFAFFAMEETLDKLGCTGQILETVKLWEQLRIANAFPDELKQKLKLPETDWHLEKNEKDETEYLLYETDSKQQFTCDLSQMQPGQKGGSDWSYTNQYEKQAYQLKLRVLGDGYIENPCLITTNGTIKIECKVLCNQYVLYDGLSQATVTDKNYNVISTCKTIGAGILNHGQQPLSFTCEHGGDEPPEVQVSIYTRSEPTIIKMK